MLEEKVSKHLGVPFITIEHEGELKYLCCNGVLFTDSEYKNYTDLSVEYERREKEDKLYDYAYAKSTGILRKKRGTAKTEEAMEKAQEQTSSILDTSRNDFDRDNRREEIIRSESSTGGQTGVRNDDKIDTTRGLELDTSIRRNTNSSKSVLAICALLGFTSIISMYISTLHTATYLMDYADLISAWFMSASVTAYNSTAFEVSVLFKNSKRYFMSVLFMFLWVLVTLFSMATTVSVFYDSFNFNEYQIAQENKEVDSNKLALEMLQKKESDLRESIAFKKKDIEYRQEHDYATTAVRNELTNLQEELQANLSEQQKLLEATPEVTEETVTRKESLFVFLGRLLHLEGGILEFIMSTLSAIFVNLIAPLSLTAVTELLKKDLTN